MLLGYARVSTNEQATRLQFDALQTAGCERTFSERASGASSDRPVLTKILSHTSRSDTLVVWQLDRIGRSLPHLVEIVQRLEVEGVGLRSLTEGIDIATSNGRPVYHLFGALSQFERKLTRERTVAGLAVARAGRRKGRRPPKLSAEKVLVAQRLLNEPESIVSEVARNLGIHRSTLHKSLQGVGAEKMNGEAERGLVRAG